MTSILWSFFNKFHGNILKTKCFICETKYLAEVVVIESLLPQIYSYIFY